jgi:RNA polymerase sigma-70 factor, ECF subfamily
MPPQNHQTTSDEELIALTLNDPSHYALIVKRYEDKLTRYVRRIAFLAREDVEDILQEVFLKTYRNINDFDRDLKFSSWIYRIAHNETVSHLRKIKARPHIIAETADETDQEIIQNIRADTNLEFEMDKKNLKKTMLKTIQSLDEKYRTVLILRYFEDKDYREISDILKRPVGTVSVLLNRAKTKLKEEIIKNQSFA